MRRARAHRIDPLFRAVGSRRAGISPRTMRTLGIALVLLAVAACKKPTTTTTTTTTTSTTSTSTSTTRPPTTTTRPPTTTTTTATTTTSTTLPAFGAPYVDGYLGFYDANTIPLWPKKMILMLGEADAQGPLIVNAKQVAASAGNTEAKF